MSSLSDNAGNISTTSMDYITLDAVPPAPDAASKYNWILWGKVSGRNANGFTIDDGSGMAVTVIAVGNTVANGNYVSVKGSLNVGTNPPTLTSQQITRHY